MTGGEIWGRVDDEWSASPSLHPGRLPGGTLAAEMQSSARSLSLREARDDAPADGVRKVLERFDFRGQLVDLFENGEEVVCALELPVAALERLHDVGQFELVERAANLRTRRLGGRNVGILRHGFVHRTVAAFDQFAAHAVVQQPRDLASSRPFGSWQIPNLRPRLSCDAALFWGFAKGVLGDVTADSAATVVDDHRAVSAYYYRPSVSRGIR